MSYLILGSTSFAGASLVDYLLSRDEEVIGISRSPEPHRLLQPYFNNKNKQRFTYFQYDINHDLPAIAALIAQKKPRNIIDFAGQGMVAESWQDPAQWYQTNIIAKVKLHQLLKDCDFLEKYVRVSTPEVYGNTPDKVTEEHHYFPSTPYAVSHAAIDMSLLAFHKNYQFPLILTRFANFYGPHQQLYRIVPRTMIYALTGRTLSLHGGGITERMFIYADDIASGIYQTLAKGRIGQTYHFSADPLVSIRTLVEKICCLLNRDVHTFVQTVEERAGKDNKYVMDTSKTKKELDWQPGYSLEAGLEKTLAWVQNNLAALAALPLNYVHKA